MEVKFCYPLTINFNDVTANDTLFIRFKKPIFISGIYKLNIITNLFGFHVYGRAGLLNPPNIYSFLPASVGLRESYGFSLSLGVKRPKPINYSNVVGYYVSELRINGNDPGNHILCLNYLI